MATTEELAAAANPLTPIPPVTPPGDAMTQGEKDRLSALESMSSQQYYEDKVDGLKQFAGKNTYRDLFKQTPTLQGAYNRVDQGLLSNPSSAKGNGSQRVTDGDRSGHAASCISGVCAANHALGIENWSGDLNNNGEGYVGNQTAESALDKDTRRSKITKYDDLKKGDLIQLREHGVPGHAQQFLGNIKYNGIDGNGDPTPEQFGGTRVFQDNGDGDLQNTVYADNKDQYKRGVKLYTDAIKNGKIPPKNAIKPDAHETLSSHTNQEYKDWWSGKKGGQFEGAQAYHRNNFDDMEVKRQAEIDSIKNKYAKTPSTTDMAAAMAMIK